MFDIGFSEMVVIAFVALVVIGPERLPAVARTLGTLLGRMRRYTNDVKAEVNRELQLEEVRKMQQDLAAQAKALGEKTSGQIAGISNAVDPAQPELEEENRIHQSPESK
jgi:sec-independent protein translocase protein TatB